MAGPWSTVRSIGKGLETLIQDSNAPVSRVWSGVRDMGGSAYAGASKIAKDIATRPGGLRSGRFAMQAGLAGAAGAGAGYYASDGDKSSTLKGFGLGVLGAGAWNVSRSPALRTGISDGISSLKGWGADASSWANKGMSKGMNKGARYVDKMAVSERNASRAGRFRRVPSNMPSAQ